MIGPRARAGLGQLLEREERPQLWEGKTEQEPGTKQASQMVTFQAQYRGPLETDMSFRHSLHKHGLSPLGVRHSARHCWGWGASRCVRHASYPGEKRHINK